MRLAARSRLRRADGRREEHGGEKNRASLHSRNVARRRRVRRVTSPAAVCFGRSRGGVRAGGRIAVSLRRPVPDPNPWRYAIIEPAMPRLGVLLLRAGAVTEENVNRALAVQGFAGGRLGTLLLERGSASEDDIGKALAEQHGCEYVPWTRPRLGARAPSSRRFPAKFAIRHSARARRGSARDSSASRCAIRRTSASSTSSSSSPERRSSPAVAPEVRIYQALEKYYGERRTPRFAILAEKLSRPIAPSVIRKPLPPPPDFSFGRPRSFRPVWLRGEPGRRDALLAGLARSGHAAGRLGRPARRRPPTSRSTPSRSRGRKPPATGAWPAAAAAPASVPPRRPPPRLRPHRSGSADSIAPPSALSAWRRMTEAPPPPGRPSRPPSGMPSNADLGDDPGGERSRRDLRRRALRRSRRRFLRSAVFVARPDGVAGWSGAGEGVDADALRRLEIAVDRALDLPERPDEPVLLPRRRCRRCPATTRSPGRSEAGPPSAWSSPC